MTPETRSKIVASLATISGIKTDGVGTLAASAEILGKVVDHVLEVGPDSVTVDSIRSLSVKVEGSKKPKSLSEAMATRVVAALSLIELFADATPRRARPEGLPKTRVRKPRTYHKESSDEEIRRISQMVVEWRIAEDGSRSLAWKQVRAELKLENDEFHKLIRLSSVYREVVISYIKSLRARPEGYEYCGKLQVATGLDAQGLTHDDIVALIEQ